MTSTLQKAHLHDSESAAYVLALMISPSQRSTSRTIGNHTNLSHVHSPQFRRHTRAHEAQALPMVFRENRDTLVES